MPRTPVTRQCRRCSHVNAGHAKQCALCSSDLVVPRFSMTPRLVRLVHVVARVQKGLTDEEYRLNLQALGLESCKQMKKQHYKDFMRRMDRLPDVNKGRHE